jgi:hypothetical protein
MRTQSEEMMLDICLVAVRTVPLAKELETLLVEREYEKIDGKPMMRVDDLNLLCSLAEQIRENLDDIYAMSQGFRKTWTIS